MIKNNKSVEPNIADLANGWLKSYGLDYKLEQQKKFFMTPGIHIPGDCSNRSQYVQKQKGSCIQFQVRRLHHCPCQREMHLPAVINMPLGLTMKKSRRCFAFLIRIMRQHGFWRNVRQSCLACIGGQKDER